MNKLISFVDCLPFFFKLPLIDLSTMLMMSWSFHEFLSRVHFPHYWNKIELEMRMHKQKHIYKGIWTTVGVKWSHALFALHVIVFLLFHGSYKQYGIVIIPIRPMVWFYSNLIVSYASCIRFILTTNNLMLYFLQLFQVLYFYWLRAI